MSLTTLYVRLASFPHAVLVMWSWVILIHIFHREFQTDPTAAVLILAHVRCGYYFQVTFILRSVPVVLSVPEQGSWPGYLNRSKKGLEMYIDFQKPWCWGFEHAPDIMLLGEESSVSPHCFPETSGAGAQAYTLPTTELRGKSCPLI